MSEEHLVMYGKGLVTNYGEGGGLHNGSFYVVALGILKGRGRKKFPLFKGGAKSFGPTIFPFCSPPTRN